MGTNTIIVGIAIMVLWTTTSNMQTLPHGVRELTESAVFDVPAGVSTISVELWAAGGGGGGGAEGGPGVGPGAGGGGGGGGAYVRAVLAVKAGESYTISLGTGGAAGKGAAGSVRIPEDGSAGGQSSVRFGTTIVLLAAGGEGGKAKKAHRPRVAAGGTGGSVPRDSTSMIVRAGNDGSNGETGSGSDLDTTMAGGAGGPAIMGTIRPRGSHGGAGGTGRPFGMGGANGSSGGGGAAIVTW
jgi:hypothetical protein